MSDIQVKRQFLLVMLSEVTTSAVESHATLLRQTEAIPQNYKSFPQIILWKIIEFVENYRKIGLFD